MPLALFDLDNTLIDRTRAFGQAAHALAAAHGLDPDVAVPFIIDADRDGQVVWQDWFTVVKERFALTPSVDELMAGHRPRYVAAYELEASTIEALGRLRAANWRIGIVTNGPAAQADKIYATGLDALVDGWAVSDTVGARKPDPRIFLAAAECCRADLDDGWMIGDRASADIAGAHLAGLRSIWLHRGQTWTDVAFTRDAYAERIGEPAPVLPADFAPDFEADDVAHAVDIILAN